MRAPLRNLLTSIRTLSFASIATLLLLEFGVVPAMGEQVKFPQHVVGSDF